MAEPKKGSCRICGNEASVCDACHMVSLASAEYEIKTRGEEVLELACKAIKETPKWYPQVDPCEDAIRQAYREKYGGK